jgi:hypothetical protein
MEPWGMIFRQRKWERRMILKTCMMMRKKVPQNAAYSEDQEEWGEEGKMVNY